MDLSCSVDHNGDRRKSGSRRHVETLEQRILDLEGLLHRTTPSRQQSELLWEDDADPRSEGTGVPVASGPPTSAYAAAAPLYASPSSALDLSLAEGLPALDSHCMDMHPHAEPCASCCRGKRGQDSGALGPTAQYRARSSGIIQSYSHHDHPYIKEDVLAHLGVALDTNTVQVKCRLLQSFFRYQPLWVNSVDENLFWENRENHEPSMWYSNFLETVMLASACRLSNSSAVRSLGEQYSIQAKADILQALENPSAASLQGFLMLSEYEVSQGRERMGWQFCGMACRLLTDIGLHESPDVSDEAETIHIKRARLNLLGACISLEGIWCMYLGRPTSIPSSIHQAAALSCEQYQGPDSTTLAAWLGLCGPMADICDVLNSSRHLNDDAKNRLSQYSVNLQSCLDKLPVGFVYNEPSAADLDPTAYSVHMQYCKVQILVLQSSDGDDVADESRRVHIYDAAIRIIRLLLIYRQIHGTERIRSVMLDAVNLALETLVDQYLQHRDLIETRKHDIQWLHLAIKSMIDIQPHFPIIGRMLNSLAAAVEGTPLASLFRAIGPYLSPGCSSSTDARTYAEPPANAPDILGNEPMTAGEFTADDIGQLSPSFLYWSNPQVESFWGLASEPLTMP
ncbi:hypothetical protein V498_04641 [Pseudogymnoascus sp. VKM F-4517 (FW-2822)]|nr:hypothetical protein V498_04641 [Pseudogymnoascus sp. VKM F-4517 (FW-2822)]